MIFQSPAIASQRCRATPPTLSGSNPSSTDTLAFLRSILPEEGIHYLALFTDGHKFPLHKAFTDLETMAYAIEGMANSKSVSVYHACASYQKAFIEIDDGKKTKRKYRIPENWDRAKAFWVDIDCGQEKFNKGQGYLTKRDAVVAAYKFANTIGWPKPLVVDSGNGIHLYWPLIKPIASDQWVTIARDLKIVLKQCGVLSDPSRTADFSSILRPHGSVNRKNGTAKPVSVMNGCGPIFAEELARKLKEFMTEHGVDSLTSPEKVSPKSASAFNGDLTVHLKGPEGQSCIDTITSALKHLDPGMPRDPWRTVVWAVRHGVGDTTEGLDLADRWSRGDLSEEFNTPSNYSDRRDVMQVWSSYDANFQDRVTVGSLYKMATDKGWAGPSNTAGTSNDLTQRQSSAKTAWSDTFTLTDGHVCILQTPPAKRSYVLANTVTAGTYNVLAGSGGTLKTMLMLITAASMAVGKDLGIDMQIAQGASMLFLGEEDRAEVARRLSAVCLHYDFDPAVVSQLVKAFPAAGLDLRLTRERNGTLDACAFVQLVIELAEQHAQACGDTVRLIVFDHARLVMDGDPDDAAHVTQLTRVLTHIAQATGAAVMLLAHSPKTVLKQQAKEMSIADVAGSSAFSDNARSGFIMYGMREDDAKAYGIADIDRSKYLKLQCAKANYGPQGTEWWFEKITLVDWQTAVLKPVSLIKPMFGQGKAKLQLRQRILELLASAPLSVRSLRDRAGQQRSLGASEKEVLSAVTALLEDGRIQRRKPTTAEVLKHQLHKGRELLFII